jgi:hypothetical protein
MAPEQLAGDSVDARCDQFAFCVVAWEALFGKRPFAGNTLAALEDAIHRQDIQRPGRTDVPQRVRDVIERGLLVKAEDRYADMPALLAALRAAAAPRTKRYLAAGIATAVFLGAGGYAAISFAEARRQAAACDAEAASVRDVLGPIERFDIRRAFLATRSSYATQSFEHSIKVLDQYTGKLADQVHAVCRGIDEPVSLSLARRSCLNERKQDVAAFVSRMKRADVTFVQRAASSAWAMFDPSPCTEPSLLIAQPIVKGARTPEATDKLDRAKDLIERGHYAEAAQVARGLVDAAHAQHDKGLELTALHQLATALANSATPEDAAPIYQQCAQLAESMGRDLDAAGSLWALANLYGVELQQFKLAHQYIDLARAKLERLGGGNLAVRGELLVTEAQVLLDENRLGEAEKLLEQSVTALEQAYGPQHPKVGSSLGTLSQAQRALGKDSLAASQRCYDIFEAAYGPDHPTSAGSELNLAQALLDAGKLDEARDHFLRADAVFAKLYGEWHPMRAAVAGNLANVEQAQRHWDAAEAADRRAIAILEKLQGPDSADVSGARRDLARVLALAGKLPAAIAEMHTAIAPLEKMGSDGEGRIVSAYTEIAEYQLAAGKPADALPNAERAVALALKRPVDANPAELGDAKFALARALWDTKRDRARARKLVGEADPLIQGDEKRAELTSWLRDHPADSLR